MQLLITLLGFPCICTHAHATAEKEVLIDDLGEFHIGTRASTPSRSLTRRAARIDGKGTLVIEAESRQSGRALTRRAKKVSRHIEKADASMVELKARAIQNPKDDPVDCVIGETAAAACTCGMRDFSPLTCEKGQVCRLRNIDGHGYSHTACETAEAGEPAEALPASEAHQCVGGWQIGDGHGGIELKLGEGRTHDECIREAKAQCAAANGVTFSAVHGACYCEFGMTGANTNADYKHCAFFPNPLCRGGIRIGDGLGSETKVSDKARSLRKCKEMALAKCPNANGMTVRNTKGEFACFCEVGMKGSNTNTDYSSCIFP